MVTGDGPDRERLEGLASGLNGQVRFTGRVGDEELADLYARCSAVFYAPVDEDFGMVPFEAFLSEKPVLTTTDAGGPLEVVHDRETGLVVAPDAAEIGRACTYLVAHEDEAAAWGRAGKAVAERLSWDSAIDEAARVKVAYYSPLPPERSGIADYSALLLPALRERVEVLVASAASAKHRAAPTSRSTTSATTPTRTAGSSTRCAGGPGVVVLHDFVLHHLVAGITLGPPRRHGYLDAMERDAGVVGRLLAHGVIDKRMPPLWETRPRGLPARRELLAHATRR